MPTGTAAVAPPVTLRAGAPATTSGQMTREKDEPMQLQHRRRKTRETFLISAGNRNKLVFGRERGGST